jgi:hypothetical protein
MKRPVAQGGTVVVEATRADRLFQTGYADARTTCLPLGPESTQRWLQEHAPKPDEDSYPCGRALDWPTISMRTACRSTTSCEVRTDGRESASIVRAWISTRRLGSPWMARRCADSTSASRTMRSSPSCLLDSRIDLGVLAARRCRRRQRSCSDSLCAATFSSWLAPIYRLPGRMRTLSQSESATRDGPRRRSLNRAGLRILMHKHRRSSWRTEVHGGCRHASPDSVVHGAHDSGTRPRDGISQPLAVAHSRISACRTAGMTQVRPRMPPRRSPPRATATCGSSSCSRAPGRSRRPAAPDYHRGSRHGRGMRFGAEYADDAQMSAPRAILSVMPLTGRTTWTS